jgi:hypothetical protein
MITPVAHAGHWIANTLYALPVIVLFVAVARQRWRDRHRPDDQLPED